MASRVSSATSMLRRHGSIAPSGRGVVLPVFHPAARGGRSLFPSRVFAPDEVGRVLKSGHQSRKIGAFVTKGPRKGWPIYTLTLEERATCPRSCTEWLHCYGNNMQAAERIEATGQMEGVTGTALIGEVRALAERHPGGFVVRLHVLGDFPSERYVALWRMLLDEVPALHLFGFTAHPPTSPIGRAVALLAADFGWSRAAFRFSGQPHEARAARVVAAGDPVQDGVLCPAQTGATDCCGTCGLCWQSERSIVFRRH
ncbi:GP88 family protein [Tsuneonella sp. HG222]